MRHEKLHAVVARSTFPSQNAQSTTSDHFWKLQFRKRARGGSAKHISKSKCTKHTMFGPLLEVEMSKSCTPLWREALLTYLFVYVLGVLHEMVPVPFWLKEDIHFALFEIMASYCSLFACVFKFFQHHQFLPHHQGIFKPFQTTFHSALSTGVHFHVRGFIPGFPASVGHSNFSEHIATRLGILKFFVRFVLTTT